MRNDHSATAQRSAVSRSRRGLQRRQLVFYIGITVVVAACGVTQSETRDTVATIAPAESTTNVTEPVGTTAAVPAVEAPAPQELANRLLTAYSGSDPAAWKVLFAPDSGIFDPIDWDFVEDYDGDGVITFADWQQFKIAMHGAVEYECEWECESVSADKAQCAITGTDAFFELAGTAPPPVELVERFDAGLLAAEESLPPADPGQWNDQKEEAETGRSNELTKYEDWVAETHPDLYTAVFDGPGGEESVDWVTLPSAVPIHEELMAEYLDDSPQATGADLLPTATTGTITVVARDWVGLEGHQVLVAVVPDDNGEVRSRWYSSADDGGYYEGPFAGSVSWGSLASDRFSGEAVARSARPFDWFRGSEESLARDAAQLSSATYAVVLMASGRPGPIANWADDRMPFAPNVCIIDAEVTDGENTRLVVPDFPTCPLPQTD